MANEQNLKPCEYKFSKEEQSKGGKRSAEVKKERKTLRQYLEIISEQEVTNKKGETATKKEVVAIQLFTKAMHGDLKAIDMLSELLGEKVIKTEVTGADGKPLIPQNKMTLEEINKEIERLRKAHDDAD